MDSGATAAPWFAFASPASIPLPTTLAVRWRSWPTAAAASVLSIVVCFLGSGLVWLLPVVPCVLLALAIAWRWRAGREGWTVLLATAGTVWLVGSLWFVLADMELPLHAAVVAWMLAGWPALTQPRPPWWPLHAVRTG